VNGRVYREAGKESRKHVAPGEKVVADGRRNREGDDGVVMERIVEELKGGAEEFQEIKHETDVVKEAKKGL
jgi:hypothetical protein